MEKHQPKDASELKGKTGLRRLMNAAKYSAQGFRGAWQTEEAFRQEAILACVMLPVAVLLPVTTVEKLLLIFDRSSGGSFRRRNSSSVRQSQRLRKRGRFISSDDLRNHLVHDTVHELYSLSIVFQKIFR